MEEVRKNKFWKSSLIFILIVTAAGGITLYFIIPTKEQRYISENCPALEDKINQGTFVGSDDFIDCRGIIAVERWDKNVYMLMRIFYPNQELDERRSIRDFKISGDFLYYVDEPSATTGYARYSDLNGYTYYGDFLQVNGKRTGFEYVSLNDVPIYRKVNTKTGDFTLYKILKVVPDNEKAIFEELENSNN